MLSTPKGKSKLFLASSLCDGLEDNNIKQIITLLENNEADPNVLLPTHGITPFHLVIGNESTSFAEQVTKLFLRHSGNPNVKSDDGATPVHVAAAWGRVKILELLLANGGDPMSLDDDGRTPFHYAFDGLHYDAITVLGKYCAKNQNTNDDYGDDNDDNEDHSEEQEYEPNIQIKLEKILVNRGDVIAEYVPSENDVTNYLQCETRSDLVEVKKMEGSSENNLECNNQSDSNSTGTNSTSIDEPLNLNSKNITFRRGQVHAAKNNILSPILNIENMNLGLKKTKVKEKKLFNDQITNKLPNSFNITNKKSSKMQSEKKQVMNNNEKKICRQIPQSKYSNNSKTKENITKSRLFNTSIVSTSPNFKLSAVAAYIKNENSSKEKRANEKKKLLEKSPSTKNIDYMSKKTPLIQACNENNLDILSSSNTEINSKITNKKIIYENIKKLNDTTSDEDLEKNSKSIDNDNEKQQLIKLDHNIPIKCENNSKSAKSPGSSRQTSVNCQYQSIKNEICSDNELSMWNELNEIYNNKGQTPPASISRLINDSLSNQNTSRSSLFSEVKDTKLDVNNDSNNYIDSIVDQSNYICKDNVECTQNTSIDEGYRTPLGFTIGSRSSIQSFMSVDEEYAYVDVEKDIAFTERRLRVISNMNIMDKAMYESTWLNQNVELSSMTSKYSPRNSEEFRNIYNHIGYVVSNASLRHQLIALGDVPGPITHTTHDVYLKRLYKLKRENSINLNQCIIASKSQNEIITSPKLPETLLSTDWISNFQFYHNLEELAFREYEKPDWNKKYRGGTAKTSFNYLLLDPRITKDLPRNGRDLCLAERWKIFLKAIFYVGKGKNARPFAHLYQSHEIWTGKRHDDESNEKIQRILNIWREGKGVVCHQIFMHSMQEEAFTREAAMIDALGTKHLSNCNRGIYYGLATTMNNKEKKALGKYLLYKAMEILMHDGERQQFPRNIE